MRRTPRQWAADTVQDVVEIALAGAVAAVLIGVLAGHLWTLALLIPAAVVWRLQNPTDYR